MDDTALQVGNCARQRCSGGALFASGRASGDPGLFARVSVSICTDRASNDLLDQGFATATSGACPAGCSYLFSRLCAGANTFSDCSITHSMAMADQQAVTPVGSLAS